MAFTIELAGGVKVYAELSPCCRMYPGYGLQYSLSLKEKGCNAESVFVNDKAVDPMAEGFMAANAVSEHAVKWLKANGVKPLQDKLDAWIAAEAEFRAEDAKRAAKEAKKDAARAAKYKADGYTHRVIAWVHPSGGDDYQVEAFCRGAPTAADIALLLKKSTVKTDYAVSAL